MCQHTWVQRLHSVFLHYTEKALLWSIWEDNLSRLLSFVCIKLAKSSLADLSSILLLPASKCCLSDRAYLAKVPLLASSWTFCHRWWIPLVDCWASAQTQNKSASCCCCHPVLSVPRNTKNVLINSYNYSACIYNNNSALLSLAPFDWGILRCESCIHSIDQLCYGFIEILEKSS